MSGEQKSAEQRLEEVEKILDEYESKSGLPSLQHPGTEEEFQQYFLMNRQALEKLTAEDCSQIACRLNQFSYYIQRLYNREQARVNWTQEALNHIVAMEITQLDRFLKHDIKVALIVKQNSYAQSLQKIKIYAEQRVIRLTLLSNSIKNLADIVLSNRWSKIKVEK